jgi:hypothetical protein
LRRKSFKIREENENYEENYRMWNGTPFRPVLQEVVLLYIKDGKGREDKLGDG